MKANFFRYALFFLFSINSYAQSPPTIASQPVPPETPIIIKLSEHQAENIPSYPDWNKQPGQGWYVKEHYHAQDFALFVCDEQSIGAAIEFDLEQPLQPGKWIALFRHVRMRTGGENKILFEIGNRAQEDFITHVASEVSWTSKDTPRDYRWAPITFVTSTPISRLRITAKEIQRTGIGDVPEFSLNSILIDTIVITNRIDYDIVRGQKRDQLFFPVLTDQKDAGRIGLADKSGKATVPISNKRAPSKTYRIALAPENKRGKPGNQLSGGGFDAAAQPYWYVLKPKMGDEGYELTRDFLDTEQFIQGTASLKLRGFSNFYQKDPVSKVTLVSAPFILSAGDYICSFFAKAADPQVDMDVRLVTHIPDQAVFKYGPVFGKTKVRVQKKWVNHHFTASVHNPTKVQMVVSAKGFAGKPDKNGLSRLPLWLDAFSVSDKKTSFSPKNPLEIGLFSESRRLFYPGKLRYLLRMVAYDNRPEALLHYEILDLSWKVIRHGTILVMFDPKGVLETPLSIPFKRHGAYLIRMWVEDAPGSEVLLDFAMLHDPELNNAPRNLGLYTAYSPDNLQYFKKAGAGYYFSLCDYLFRPYHALRIDKELVKKKPGSEQDLLNVLRRAKHVTHDPVVRRIQDDGIEVIPELLAYQMPGWARGSPAAFGAHAGQAAAHYTKFGIKRWITGDEVRSNYLPYHEAAAKAIISENPDAKIMVSTNPGIFDHFAKKSKNLQNISAIGGSYWSMNKWVYKAEAETARKYNLPFWNIGVGWGSHPIYDDDPKRVRKNLRDGRFSLISNVLYAHAILKPEILVTYTNRFTNGQAFGTNDMYTGTFVPHGVYFALAAGFTRGATSGGDIDLKYASDLDAFYFERNNKTTVVISQSQSFWGRPRGEAAFRLQIDADPSKLLFYDIDLSEISAPRVEKTGFQVNLPMYGMLILEDRGIGKEGLIEAVSKLHADQTHGFRFMILGRKNGGLDLGLVTSQKIMVESKKSAGQKVKIVL